MVFKYCAECGHKLDDIRLGDDDCKICPECKRIYGNNPLPVVEVMVVNEFNEVLLLKQNYISEDKWTVVSGYMVNGETIEEAVAREVKEETGCDVELTGILQIGRGVVESTSFISIIFSTKIIQESIKFDKNEILDVKWFLYEELLNMKDELRNYIWITNSVRALVENKVADIDLVKMM